MDSPIALFSTGYQVGSYLGHRSKLIEEMPPQPADGEVLVVEDHQPTAQIICTAFDEVGAPVSTRFVETGEECLSVLREADRPQDVPDLVLLDLDLPDIDGLAVLEIRGKEPCLRSIPTVVLSGQTDPKTVKRCYRRGANAFVPKPDDYDGYLAVVDAVTSFWFSTATLPSALVDIDT